MHKRRATVQEYSILSVNIVDVIIDSFQSCREYLRLPTPMHKHCFASDERVYKASSKKKIKRYSAEGIRLLSHGSRNQCRPQGRTRLRRRRERSVHRCRHDLFAECTIQRQMSRRLSMRRSTRPAVPATMNRHSRSRLRCHGTAVNGKSPPRVILQYLP